MFCSFTTEDRGYITTSCFGLESSGFESQNSYCLSCLKLPAVSLGSSNEIQRRSLHHVTIDFSCVNSNPLTIIFNSFYV
jgi:hypothetical protein